MGTIPTIPTIPTIRTKKVQYLQSEIGTIGIAEDGVGISDVFFVREANLVQAQEEETELLTKAVRELREYLHGKRTRFEVPLSFYGTEFQMQVWKALVSIPYAETRSYQQIAEQIGRAKACRAVGAANHVNPIAILVPCHRVIGKSGTLVGYAGGLEIKKYLIELEEHNKNKV